MPTEPPEHPLEPNAALMRELLEATHERVEAFYAALPERRTMCPDEERNSLRPQPGPVPEEGVPYAELLDELFGEVVERSFNSAGPGYLAYVPGGGIYSAALADYVSNIVNRYAGVWTAAPAAVEIETEALRWLVKLMGMPEGSLGVFTTGGSMSNLIAIVAAREKLLGEDIARGTVYLSEEVHHSLGKAARIAGIPERNIRVVRVDDAYRIDVDALRATIAADRSSGLQPFFLIGSAGTVNTGAIDPLATLAKVAEEERLWFHVDGAYGAIFNIVEPLAPLFAGIERADSISLDPHKGLFLPYGTGVLLVRDMNVLRDAYRTTASYMPPFQDGVSRVDFCEVSPELSRGWRGLRVWLPFKLHGVGAFRAALAEKRALTMTAWERLQQEPDVEFAAPPELTLFAFRQRVPGVEPDAENERNRDLLHRINADGRIMVTGTDLDGVYYLRICVLHLRTHRERIDAALEIITRELERGRG